MDSLAALTDPLCWTWLSGYRMRVEFVRRAGLRGTYRLDDGLTFDVDGPCVLVDDEPVLRWGPGGRVTWEKDAPAAISAMFHEISGKGGAAESGVAASGVLASGVASEPLTAARALRPLMEARAADADRAHTLDRSVVDALKAAGLFRIGIPKAIGGLDLPPQHIVDVIDEVSHADGAAGWCTFIGNQSGYAAWLDEPVAATLAGPHGLILAGSTAISGRSEWAADGTYRISGRWRFNSGCLHADWLMAGFAEPPVPGMPGAPPARLAFFPPGAATIEGTWNVGGLSGSGSHDVVLTAVEVPAAYTAPLYQGPSAFGDALHRMSPYNIQAVLMSGFPLGVARRALDELDRLAADGRTGLSRTDLAVAATRARLRLRAARALVHESFAEVWDVVGTGARLEGRRAAEPALVLRYAVDEGKAVTEEAARLAGPALTAAAGSVLRRCLRDAQAVGQHIAVGDDMVERNTYRYVGA